MRPSTTSTRLTAVRASDGACAATATLAIRSAAKTGRQVTALRLDIGSPVEGMREPFRHVECHWNSKPIRVDTCRIDELQLDRRQSTPYVTRQQTRSS